MKTKLILFLLFALSLQVQAQKKHLSMQQAVLGLGRDLRIADLGQLQFMGKSNYYSYVYTKDKEEILYYANPVSHDIIPFISLQQLNTLLSNENLDTLKSFPTIHWMDEYSFYYSVKNSYYKVDNNEGKLLKVKKMFALPKAAQVLDMAEKNMAIAYKENDNLFIQKGEEQIQISQDGSKNLLYGEAVHRNEFGINGGTFWSPNGNALAFYKMDQSMVADYPIIQWNDVPAKNENIKYPMAGGVSHQVSIGIRFLDKKENIYLNIEGPKDQYLTSVTWSPDENYIYVGVLNRDQNFLQMQLFNAKSGKYIKTIFDEKNEKYVEPQHPLYFFSNDPKEFIWLSQRDGYMHMYLYQDDIFFKQVTKGDWLVNSILGYNPTSHEIIFTGSKDGYMQENIYAVNIKNTVVRNVGFDKGLHTATLSHDGTLLLDKLKNNATPNQIDVLDVRSGKSLKRLLTANNTLSEYETARVKLVQLVTENNITLSGKLIYPSNFDSTKKYPCIVYLYNGPHVQLIKDGFPYTGNLWYDYMADKGYFIFTMDGRGSSNRGFNFESATFKQLGKVEMEDQMKGVKFLKSLPYIDANRLGVHGWSFGGFMTTSLMINYPDVFKCAVAGGPVMDWSMYEIMYTERYMDTPETNKMGYDNTRIWDKMDKVKGKLLLIHGAQDDVVVWQHSMKAIKNSVDNNVQLDYFVYPGHPHNVRGKDRVHLMQKISDYFDLYLNP